MQGKTFVSDRVYIKSFPRRAGLVESLSQIDTSASLKSCFGEIAGVLKNEMKGFGDSNEIRCEIGDIDIE